MLLIETSIFTKQIVNFLNDEEYAKFQNFIVNEPDSGKIIKGTKGLRKIRWKTNQKGKSGGMRIIYYWAVSKDIILLLFAYEKSQKVELTKKQIEILRTIIEKEYK